MDQTFLLPFSELPRCSLHSTISPDAISQSLDLPTSATCFQDCDIRYADESSAKRLQRHTLTIGHHILLRPVDNSQRPSIAEVVCFWSDKSVSNTDSYVRLLWFYRAEDLGTIPTYSIGEDELFRTHHVDDCSVESIAGRCLVQSYSDWVKTSSLATPTQSQPSQPNNDSHSDSYSHVSSSFGDNYASSSLHFYVRRVFNPASDSLQPVDEAEWAEPTNEPIPDSDNEFVLSPRDLKERRSRGRSDLRSRERASHIVLPTGLDRDANIQCRDSQKKQISGFLSSTLLQLDKAPSASHCLYISGVPGTGKTASVREVVHLFRKSYGPALNLEVVEINAMCLSDSSHIYASLAKAGLQNTSSSNRRSKRPGAAPASSTDLGLPKAQGMRKRVLVILDEVDNLVTRSQTLLYDILNWPATNSNVAVICISNTMNLPEKMLPRISSRLGVNRLSFPPYTAVELRTILGNLLGTHKSDYDQEAIKLCAAKVGAISGDVRRAMEIMQLSAELSLARHGLGNPVTAEIVDEAIQEMAEGCYIHSVEQTCRYERLLLCCSVVLQRNGVCAENLPMNDVLKKVQDEAQRLGFETPSRRQLEESCWMLSARNIVSIENAEYIGTCSLRLNLRSEDILFALRNCAESKQVLQPILSAM